MVASTASDEAGFVALSPPFCSERALRRLNMVVGLTDDEAERESEERDDTAQSSHQEPRTNVAYGGWWLVWWLVAQTAQATSATSIEQHRVE